jgi:hypothetical protein
MNLKLAPWLLVAGLLAGMAVLYFSKESQTTELARLRLENQELQQAQAAVEATRGARAQSESEELTRLRKDSAEVLRLRNEVRQLRDQDQQLSRQVQAAQAQTAQLQAQHAQAPPPPAPGQPPAPPPPGVSPAQAAALQGRPAATPEQTQLNACINNLRILDGAKQQWALEHAKPGGALPNISDVTPYLRSNTLPVCPSGGAYTLSAVALPPTCTISGHVLTK